MATKFKTTFKRTEHHPFTLEFKKVRRICVLECYTNDGYGKVCLLSITEKEQLRKLAKAILAEVGE